MVNLMRTILVDGRSHGSNLFLPFDQHSLMTLLQNYSNLIQEKSTFHHKIQKLTKAHHFQLQEVSRHKEVQDQTFLNEISSLKRERDSAKLQSMQLTQKFKVLVKDLNDNDDYNVTNDYKSVSHTRAQSSSQQLYNDSMILGDRSNSSQLLGISMNMDKTMNDENQSVHKYYKERETDYLRMIDSNQREVQRLRSLLSS